MIQKIFTVHDGVADAYLTPFFLPNTPMAVRAICDCLSDTNHAFGKNPQDYTLFEIGTFNDATAEIEYITPYESLGNGLDLKKMLTNVLEEKQDAAQ